MSSGKTHVGSVILYAATPLTTAERNVQAANVLAESGVTRSHQSSADSHEVKRDRKHLHEASERRSLWSARR